MVGSSEMAENSVKQIEKGQMFDGGEKIQEKKHAAMLKHLANLNDARLKQTELRKSDILSAPVFESVELFLKKFSESKEKIQRTLDEFHEKATSQEKTHLKSISENISIQINDLENLVAENSYFLPSYEVRTAQNAIAGLKEKLENVTAQILPKKKFSFSNRLPKAEPPKIQQKRDAGGASTQIGNSKVIQLEKDKMVGSRAPGFRNMEGRVLVRDLDASKDGDFELSDLRNCKIYLRGRLRALFIHKLKDCQVFAGPVMGSALIEEVENCTFMLASHQIRIHQTLNTDFYLRVRSRPIVEYTSGVRFAPYAVYYPGIEEELRESDLVDETGMWANVDDFRWLRAVASPNWSILPENERLGLIDISDLKADEIIVP